MSASTLHLASAECAKDVSCMGVKYKSKVGKVGAPDLSCDPTDATAFFNCKRVENRPSVTDCMFYDIDVVKQGKTISNNFF